MKKIKMLSLIALCAIGISSLSACDENTDNSKTSIVSTVETASYKVEYYLQTADLSDYRLESEQTFTGVVGNETVFTAKEFEGYIINKTDKVIINSNGSSVAKAYYRRATYGLSLKANNNSYGITTGSKACTYESINTITAEPYKGYKFVGWYLDDELVSNLSTYEYKMPASNVQLEARFVPNETVSYKINVYYQNLENDEYTLEKTKEGYGLAEAYTNVVAEEVTGYSSKNIEQVEIKADGSSEVNIYYDRIKKDVLLSSSNNEYGKVTGAGHYKYGTTVDITATPETNCRFLGWYNGDNKYSDDQKLTLTVGETNISLVAKFEEIPSVLYTVKHYFQNIDNDKYTLDSYEEIIAKEDTVTTAKAKEAEGFTVKEFNQVTLKDGVNTVIEIYYDRNEYEINNTVNDSNIGSITGNKKYKYGENVELTASPIPGYKFVGWFAEGSTEPVSTDAKYKFTMPANNISYEARFEVRTDIPYMVNHYIQNVDNDEYTVKYTDNLQGKAGDTTVAAAKELEGFDVVSFDQEAIDVDGETVISIYYNRKEYDITITLNSTHLTLENDISGKYKYGKELNLKVTPEDGYVFTGWYNNGELFDSNLDLNLTFTMPASNLDLECSAVVVKTANYTVNHYLEQNGGTFSLEYTDNLSGDTYTKTNAVPKEISGYLYEPFKQEVINPTGDTVVNIYYVRMSSKILISSNMEQAGTITGDGIYSIGDEATLVATPNTDYIFLGWYDNDGNLLSDQEEFKYNVTGSIRIEARFKLIEGIENLIIDSTSGKKVLVGIKDTTIKELVIPNEIDEIQAGALKGCSQLEKLTIPFAGAKRYTTDKPTDGVAFGYIFGTEAYNGSYIISQYDRYGKSSNYYLPKSLYSVTVTDTTIIQYGAFSKCDQLVFINIPDNVVKIGEYAFYMTYRLVTFTIPETVTSIGGYAFIQCYSLYEIYNLSSVEPTANNGLKGKNIYTSLDVKSGLVIDGDYIFFYGKNIGWSDSLVMYIGNESDVTIPEKFYYEAQERTSFGIARYTFYNNTNIRSVVLPNNVSSFGDYPFKGCINLREVYNLSTKKITCGSTENGYIAYYATAVYTSLTDDKRIFTTRDGYQFTINNDDTLTLSAYSGFDIELQLPTNIEVNDKEYTSYNIAKNTFMNNTEIVKVIIPSCVTSIGESVFKNCSNLETVILPNNLTRIEKYTFAGCSSLKSLILPDDLTYLDQYIFQGCSSLDELIIPSGVKSLPNDVFYEAGMKKIVLPDDLQAIPSRAFAYCNNLLSITIPDSVTSLADRVFINCTSLETVHLGKGITELKDHVFNGCYALKNVNIENIKSIGVYVFNGCKSLESITLPEAITVISDHLFAGCRSMKSITFTSPITSIGTSAFAYCNALESIELTDSLVSIGERAFEECESLKYIAVPNSVETIGEYAFKGCVSITYLVLPSNDKYTEIGKHIIYSQNAVETVVISKNITSMNPEAVMYCNNFKKVFFIGTAAELNSWSLKSDSQISGKTFYYYSETKPASGNAWHYDSIGTPVAW